MTIGENLRRLREDRELSQPDLAGLSGVSQQLISQIERDVNRSTKHLPALAKALKVSIEEIDPSYRPADDEAAELARAFNAMGPDARKKLLARARALREKEGA